MHREGGGDGPGLPRTGLTHDAARRGDSELGPRGGAGAGLGGEAGRAGIGAARARKDGVSAEALAALRRLDAFNADTRAMLARIKAGTFWPDPAGRPRLRAVGGRDEARGVNGEGRPLHRESTDAGRSLRRTGAPRSGTSRGDPDLAPHRDAGPGSGREEDGGRVRAARTRHGRVSAAEQAMPRRADAVIAEARALLARFEADAFHPDPAVPPRLRVVGGTAWSGE